MRTQEEREQLRTKIYQLIQDLFQITDMSGVEVFSSLNRITQILYALDIHLEEDGQSISGPRWRLMLYLFLVEQVGTSEGVTPTELSKFQQVSKNTVSALLRGLEDQGYIVREMDPKDLRIFRIRLSETGRQLMLETTPKRILKMNQLLSHLTEPEIQQLTQLLTKLRLSLEDQLCHS